MVEGELNVFLYLQLGPLSLLYFIFKVLILTQKIYFKATIGLQTAKHYLWGLLVVSGKSELWTLHSTLNRSAFLSFKNQAFREIRETLLFTTTTKRIKYLGLNLPKETKDLYAENYKTLMKEIKDDTNRGRDIPCS